MAYTISGPDGETWVRLINQQDKKPRVCKAFPAAWVCDPCAPARARYRVQHSAGWREHAWYEVITNADTARERAAKWAQAGKVIAAAQVLAAAEQAYRKLLAG